MELQAIARSFLSSAGLKRKLVLKPILEALGVKFKGEDAGFLEHGPDYLVFCLDGIWEPLLKSDPRISGYYSVLVTLHDLAAMGAQPLGMLDYIGYSNQEQLRAILDGIAAGIQKFEIQMLGGHTSPDSNPSLVTCGLGLVPKQHLIRSDSALAGDRLVLGLDLSGKFNPPQFDCWDSTSFRSSSELRSQLSALRELAELGLINSGKDVSNSGILGTAGMLAEASGLKAIIDLDLIPSPGHAPMERWLRSYLGMGFLVSCPAQNSEQVISVFRKHSLQAAEIGQLVPGAGLIIRSGEIQLQLLNGNEFGFR